MPVYNLTTLSCVLDHDAPHRHLTTDHELALPGHAAAAPREERPRGQPGLAPAAVVQLLAQGHAGDGAAERRRVNVGFLIGVKSDQRL